MLKKNIMLILLCTSLCGFASSEYLVRNGTSEHEIITANNPDASFAGREFREIMKKGTGVEFGKNGKKKIYIGLSPELEKVVGKDRIAKLRDGETLVLEKNGNIYLIGGGERGTLYAVYDFVEKYLNYRCYGTYPGAEMFRKTKDLPLDGKEFSTCPAFLGYRMDFSYAKDKNTMLFMMRCRNNGEPGFDIKGAQIPRYRSKYFRVTYAQHGLLLYVPAKTLDLTKFLKVEWKGMFDKHPEYFSMDENGKRVPNAQLCFGNPDLRKLMTERFLKVVSLNGKGVYMLGSNDSHNVRYCFCPECKKLIDKYQTNGGPLWDYILELCKELKKYPDSYVTSLAYKGPEQTELAPTGIVFPDNFICDAAFLNTDRPLKEVKDIKLPDGRVFNRIENLKKWVQITKQVSYWLYVPDLPCQVFTRMQEEIQELKEAGVKSVGACGVGGGVEFRDIARYMYFQLLRNPNLNGDKVLNEILNHKYGAAAPQMREYIRELETEGIKCRALDAYVYGTEDTYEKMAFLPARKIVEWQKMFDRMEQQVSKNPIHKRNVAIARLGVDCWTTVFASKISKECPDWEFDPQAILKRGLTACDLAEKAGMVDSTYNSGRRVLESMQYYAYLKNDALPPELTPLSKTTTVHRFLPVQPHKTFEKTQPLIKDPKAAAGIAMTAKLDIPAGKKMDKILIHFRDAIEKIWLMPRTFIDTAKLKQNEYTLIRIGECRLPRFCLLVFANAWGTSADVRSLGRYYDPSYHDKIYEYFASVRVSGPAFYPSDKGENRIYIDQIFLVDKGMPEKK